MHSSGKSLTSSIPLILLLTARTLIKRETEKNTSMSQRKFLMNTLYTSYTTYLYTLYTTTKHMENMNCPSLSRYSVIACLLGHTRTKFKIYVLHCCGNWKVCPSQYQIAVLSCSYFRVTKSSLT